MDRRNRIFWKNKSLAEKDRKNEKKQSEQSEFYADRTVDDDSDHRKHNKKFN